MSLPAIHTNASLSAIFSPSAVAIVGASGRPGSPFSRPVRYLTEYGYEGRVFPINPGYETLEGRRCYGSLEALPEPVDLVVMLVSAAETKRQLAQAAAAGAQSVIVAASGFAETGADGKALQDDLVSQARRHGLRLLGPNCQGVLATDTRMAATFTAGCEDRMPNRGNVAYVGQSGAVGGSVLSLARERGLGIAYWATTGNEADLRTVDVANHLIDDERVSVLALYQEGAVHGADYLNLLERASARGVSVVVLRSGRSVAGARAASSHTGAMTGPDAAFMTLSRERGVALAHDVDDFISTVHALSSLPRAHNNRVAIVSTSGGAGGLAADQADDAGLAVEPLQQNTREALSSVIPDFGAVENPVDVTAQLFRDGDEGAFLDVVRMVADDANTDAVMVVVTLVTGSLAAKIARGLSDLSKSSLKPIISVWLVSREQSREGRDILRDEGIPVAASPHEGMQMLHALVTEPTRSPAKLVPSEAIQEACSEAALQGLVSAEGVVAEAAGATLMEAAGLARMPEALLTEGSLDEAVSSVVQEIPGPYVLKVQSTNILHKSDRGGVRLGVSDQNLATAARELLDDFADVDLDGVLIQQQAPPGIELIIGVTNYESGLPALVSVGLGGVATELYRDTASRTVPVDEREALDMIAELRAAPLLYGYRGRPPVALDGAARAVAAISEIAVVLGSRLHELEINPLRLVEDGNRTVALDFLMLVADVEGATADRATNPFASTDQGAER